MLWRLLSTLLTAGCLYGAFSLYALWVSPLVERDETVAKDQNPAPKVHHGRGPESPVAKKHLPNVRWTWNANYQTRSDDRYIFCEEWERTPSGEIQFSPFAMITIDEAEPDKPPTTVVSQSALIQFEEKFEMASKNPGRIVGGALKGHVQIRGDNGLEVFGKNIFFQEVPPREPGVPQLAITSPRAWSDEKVAFQYAGSRGSGLGLEMKLIPKRSDISRDKPAIEGIHTVRLRSNVEMHLRQENDKPGAPPERVQINSRGPFEFDLRTNIAKFEDQVHVVRRVEKDQVETLEGCDQLTIVFGIDETKPEEKTDDEQSDSLTGDLTFKRMLADGKRLKLTSSRSQLEALMQRLTYESRTKAIVLKDERQNRRVHVTQENNEFHCPELTLVHDEDGEILTALGRGEGWMFSKDTETGLRAFQANWQDQVLKRPDPKSDQQIIQFNGKAVLQESRTMALEADVIKVWLDEKAPSTPNVEAETVKQSESPRLGGNFKIQRLIAVGEVAFASPQLLGGVKKLELWFEDGLIPRWEDPLNVKRESRERLRVATHFVTNRRTKPVIDPLQVAAGGRKFPRRRTNGGFSQPNGTSVSPVRTLISPKRIPLSSQRGQVFASTDDDVGVFQVLNDGEITSPELQSETVPAKDEPDEPIDILANKMRILVIREVDEHHVAEVKAYGDVDVIQEHLDGGKPLHIQGDQMHVVNQDQSNRHQIISIFGKRATETTAATVAHVRDRGMHLEGKMIKTDRKLNMVWVNSDGVMQLPVNNSLDGKELQSPELLSVWWQEKMNFDGTVAKFYDNVRILLEDSKVTCGQMDVTLTERISFSDELDSQDRQTEPKIREVLCKEGVQLKGRRFAGNRLMGTHRGEVFELRMNQLTGKMLATGGGWIESRRREDNDPPARVDRSVSTTTNRSLGSDTEKSWTYSKITFRGEMQGNIASLGESEKLATTMFYDTVEVVYGPVDLPTQSIDPDDLTEDSATLESDVLRITRIPRSTESPKPYFTMQGRGNARLTGHTYSGRAEEVSYDQSLDRYNLRTPKPNLSVFWRRPNRSGPEGTSTAHEFVFYPSRNRLVVSGGKTINLQN